jgi:hypothetical protein
MELCYIVCTTTAHEGGVGLLRLHFGRKRKELLGYMDGIGVGFDGGMVCIYRCYALAYIAGRDMHCFTYQNWDNSLAIDMGWRIYLLC